MILSNTSYPITYHLPLRNAVDIMSGAGFDAIDFSAGNEEYYGDTHNKEFYLELKKYAESKGIFFNQAHAPTPSAVESKEESEIKFRNIVGSMRNASYLGAKTIVVHPIKHLRYDFEENTERLFEYNMEFYNRLIPYCEEYGVRVALENLWQKEKPGWDKITHSVCSRPEEFIRYIDTLNSDWLTACLDIGHAQLVCEDPANFIKALGNKRLTCLHVHDVNGMIDSHDPPYFGVVDWDRVMKALVEIDYQGDFTFEVCGEFFKSKLIELSPVYMRMIADTGRFLLNKYNKFKEELSR